MAEVVVIPYVRDMATLGADPDALDALSRTLTTWADEMSSSGTSIDALVGRVAWQGNDAMRFRARWRSQMRPELGAVTTTLEELATALTRQAAEQRRTSEADGGGSSTPYPDDRRQPVPAPTYPGAGDDPDDLTAAQKDRLAEMYAPILDFQESERYRLGDPEDFLDDSELVRVEDKNNWWDDVDTMIGRGDVDGYELQGLDDDRDWHLDLSDDDGSREGGYDDAKMLYEVQQSDEHGPQLTYWLFYPYNDGPFSQNHEGDWERISVDLDDAYRPQGVAYSGHGSPTWRDWDGVELDDGRPVAYVAQGTHANYPEAGTWNTDAPGGGPLDESAEGGERVDLLDRDAVDVTDEDYYGSDVHWGERGETEHTSGPTGPGAKSPLRDHDGLNEDEPNVTATDRFRNSLRDFATPPHLR